MAPSVGLHGLTHLLEGDTEWRNIQTVIKTTLQAIAKILSSHGTMLDTLDGRIDRLHDTIALATTKISHQPNECDEESMVVSRKEFLALVADVRKIQKRTISKDDVDARLVATTDQLKRRLDHSITPLRDTLKELEETMTTQVLTKAHQLFATKGDVGTTNEVNDVAARLTSKTIKMESIMATRDDLETIQRKVQSDLKSMHRDCNVQLQQSISSLEKSVRKHLVDHHATTREDLKRLKAQVDETFAGTSSEWQVQLRQRAMASDVKLVLSSKLDRDEVEVRETQLKIHLESCLETSLSSAIASLKQDVAAALAKKCYKSDVAKLLARKVNREDLDSGLADKINRKELQEWLQTTSGSIQEEMFQEMRRVQQVVEEKLADHGDMITQHIREVQSKQSHHEEEWTSVMEDLRSKLAVKMGIKDACTLLDSKCNVADVNDALAAIQSTIHAKTDECDFRAIIEDLHALRRQIRGELCVGRWIWKVGRPTERRTIAWNVQVINTNPDVFGWEKGADVVTAILPGLYQLQASFFTDYSPTLQVLVNGEPALVFDKEKEERRRRRHGAGNVSGLTICEFLALPPRATVSITYDVDERAQGFMTLRKL